MSAGTMRLALRETHAAFGAQAGERRGWEVPLTYGDPGQEYAALRESAAAFDLSWRSRVLVTGGDALDVLRGALAGHPEELEEGRAGRFAMLDEGGNIADLVLVARTGGAAYLVTGEPERREALLRRLEGAVGEEYDARVEDRTATTCSIGLAGPAAAARMAAFVAEALPGRLGAMHCAAFEFHGFRALAIRTSDTGEDGFVLVLAPAVASHLLGTLRSAGVALAGWEALETARVEACIPAWEPDLSPGLSPAEADLDVLLGIDGGREGRMLAAFLLEGPPVPAGTAVRQQDGRQVGEVRSCLAAMGLHATAGLAIIEATVAFPGAELEAGGSRLLVAAKPLYRRRTTEGTAQRW
jgi:glycine cleavage system aminomethyltransferase T